MMSWLVCEDVPDEYVPMMLEEMELDGTDARKVELGADAAARAPRSRSSSSAAGSRACSPASGCRRPASRSRSSRRTPTSAARGTRTRIPGCRVDVGNHFYCYSFEPSDQWTEYFAQQPELQAYFAGVMQPPRHRAATSAGTPRSSPRRWDDDDATLGRSSSAAPTATPETHRRPRGDLRGRAAQPAEPARHPRAATTSRARRSTPRAGTTTVDYRGKRVAVIGAGASGFQIVPTIAADVAELTVFQRTAQWMFPNPNYHEQVGPGVQWALRHLPFYGRWYRFLLFWPGCDGGLAAARVDPEWPHQDRAVSATNDITREIFTAWISEQVGDDPELLAKVDPRLPRHRQAHAAGQRQLAARAQARRTSSSSATASTTSTRTASSPRRARATTSTSSCTRPASRPTSSCGRWTSSAATASCSSEQWGDEPSAYLGITVPELPEPVLHVRARARTSRTAAA